MNSCINCGTLIGPLADPLNARCSACGTPQDSLWMKARGPCNRVTYIGERSAGKTCLLAAQQRALYDDLSTEWPGSEVFPLTWDALELVEENTKALKSGVVPDATPAVFASPAALHVKTPLHSANIVFHDLAGEVFDTEPGYLSHGAFVTLPSTTVFLISLSELGDARDALRGLINRYRLAIARLWRGSRRNGLVVVFTKFDRMLDWFSDARWENIRYYLDGLTGPSLRSPGAYWNNMQYISASLRSFLVDHLSGRDFVDAADRDFRTVVYCAVSALGSEPTADGRLAGPLASKRVLDPLFAVMMLNAPWPTRWRLKLGSR